MDFKLYFNFKEKNMFRQLVKDEYILLKNLD